VCARAKDKQIARAMNSVARAATRVSHAGTHSVRKLSSIKIESIKKRQNQRKVKDPKDPNSLPILSNFRKIIVEYTVKNILYF